MKKSPGLYFSFLLMVSCISTSDTSYENYTAYFAQNISSGETLTLFVNQTSKGNLPYRNTAPECGDKVLTIPLNNGTYTLEVKDANNIVRSSTNLTLDDGSVSISSGIGGSSIQTRNDCIKGLFM